MRYYTNGAGGHFNHHALLTDSTLVLISRDSMCADLYCSVQSYDSSGVETKSQLVFDIDNSSMERAYTIAKSIAIEVVRRYDTNVAIWFSGSKGFHVITGLVGYGDVANVAMRKIARTFSNEIDESMYKTRSMFRLPNSLNGKSGLRKIQVVDGESLESIQHRAKTKQPYIPTEITESRLFTAEHGIAMREYRDSVNITHSVVTDIDWQENLPPCIKTLMDTMPEGYRWDVCYWVVRHWRLCGVDVDDACYMADEHPIFEEAKYTSSMIRHAYCGEPRQVGCLNGKLAPLMQMECKDSCVHSEGWADRILGDIFGGE